MVFNPKYTSNLRTCHLIYISDHINWFLPRANKILHFFIDQLVYLYIWSVCWTYFVRHIILTSYYESFLSNVWTHIVNMNKMLKNSIISIVFCITLFCKISSALKCYDCGYLIDADGKIGPLIEGETAVNFCTGNYPENWQTKDAGEVQHEFTLYR